MVTGWPVAIFRIVFGILYLDMALRKAPWKNYGWLEGWLRQEIAHPTFGWYTAFLRDVVLPHFEVFGMLTFVTEMVLGIAFVSGTLTRFAGVTGALWQLNIAAGAFSVPGEWYWVWPLLVLPPARLRRFRRRPHPRRRRGASEDRGRHTATRLATSSSRSDLAPRQEHDPDCAERLRP